MPDGAVFPATSTAANRRTEPEVVAGISSGEGQPAAYTFTTANGVRSQTWLMVGVAAAVGLAAGLGVGRRFGR